MTTPPLDLPALRARTHSVVDWFVSSDTVRALLDRLESAEAESKVLRSAVETSNDAWAALTARAETAEKAVAAVREALEAHPKACDRHTEDDPIKCGWKRAVADVTHALDSTPYQALTTEPLVSDHHTPETETTP